VAKSKEYKKTLDRLLIIFERLINGEKLEVKKLVKEFETSKRTIQRYLNEYLSDFPIKKEKNKYFLASVFNLSEEELAKFQTIFAISKELGVKFDKLLKDDEMIYTHLLVEKIDNYNNLSTIKKAIENQQFITFNYGNKDYLFKFKPLKIVNFEGYWYLIGFDNERYKTFYLKEIKNVTLLSETFEVDDEFLNKLEYAINIWFEPKKEFIEVTFVADEIASRYIQRIPLNKSQILIRELPDGTCEFSILITRYEEIEKFVKRWIPHIIIVEPKEFHLKIKKDIEEYLKKINF
jgi:predicted DNA-binding transcriptional regulator YafY